MLLGNQRLRELRYEDRLQAESSAEESASAIRDVPQGSAAKNRREPTLLSVGAHERRAREATLVGVGLATPLPVSNANKHEATPQVESSGKADRSTDETIPRLDQTCDVSLGEMEVLAAQRAAADSTEHLQREEDDELKDDTLGEWIRFEKSFANTTIAAILCAILAFFLLPSGHDAPVPPPAARKAEKPSVTATPSAAAKASDVIAGAAAPTLPDVITGAEQALRMETAEELIPASEAVEPTSADAAKPQRRARSAEERKEFRKKRRAAREKREALAAKQDGSAKRESNEKRRKTTTESVSKRARAGGKS